MYSVAIIGAGNIAAGFDDPESKKILTHAHAVFDSDLFDLKGFFDIDKDKAECASRKWKCYAYDSLERLVTGADVCVCCAPDQHHKAVIDSLVRFDPKVIITEKPLADNLDDAKELYDHFAGKTPIAVNYSRRFIPEFREIRNRLPQNGRLLKGVAYYGKGTFHNGSHMVDLLRFLFGGVVEAKRMNLEFTDMQGDPTCDALLSAGDGTVYLVGIDSREVTIFEMDLLFEKGRIRILDGGQKIELFEKGASADYVGYYNYKLSQTLDVDYSGALTGLYRNVYGFLNGKEELLCSIDDGLEVLEVCGKIRGI